MQVGQAILHEGRTMVVKQIHDSTVTIRDENGVCETVPEEEIVEV